MRRCEEAGVTSVAYQALPARLWVRVASCVHVRFSSSSDPLSSTFWKRPIRDRPSPQGAARLHLRIVPANVLRNPRDSRRGFGDIYKSTPPCKAKTNFIIPQARRRTLPPRWSHVHYTGVNVLADGHGWTPSRSTPTTHHPPAHASQPSIAHHPVHHNFLG